MRAKTLSEDPQILLQVQITITLMYVRAASQKKKKKERESNAVCLLTSEGIAHLAYLPSLVPKASLFSQGFHLTSRQYLTA